jgi:hypothetical protein
MISKKFLFVMILEMSGCGLDLPPSTGSYQVKSDCPGAKTQEGTLEIKEDFGNILGIAEVKNAEDFGFPSNFFAYSLGGYLQVVGTSRECKSQLFKKKTKDFLFLCREENVNVCTITFKQ